MTNRLSKLRLIPFLVLVFVLCAETSLACMYGPPYKTVCETYADADAVIIGNIESVRGDGTQKVTIKVEKTFKGKEQKVILLDQPLSTCDWDFSEYEGKRMLLYLVRDKKTGSYSAIAQGMGGMIEKVSDDLYWLRRLPGSLKRTRMSGEVSVYKDEPFQFLRFATGIKVKIHNATKSFEVTTDRNGVYQLWDIPVGKYQVEPVFPNFLSLKFPLPRGVVDFDSLSKGSINENDVLIEIRGGGCGGIDFVVKEKTND